MIDKKSIVIGFIVSIVLVFSLAFIIISLGLGIFVASFGPFIGVLTGSIIAGYLAKSKKVVGGALNGVIVGILAGIVQILTIYARNGFSEKILPVLIIAALILIGAYIIIGALGGLVGMLLYIKHGKSRVKIEQENPQENPETGKNKSKTEENQSKITDDQQNIEEKQYQ